VRLLLLLLVTVLLTATANAQLERGTKGNTEDVILVSADDWHSSVAATPLAIWSEDNRTVVNPMLILPKNVNAGVRMGWVEQTDLDRYGVASVLHTLKSANITAITIHGEGDMVKSLVEAAHKEGLKAYVTASLEPPKAKPKLEVAGVEIGVMQSEQVLAAVKDSFLNEMGLDDRSPDESKVETDWLQQPNPSIGGNASLYCPVNPEARESLFNQVESLIDDYKADGVVLYEFGFQDENYCFCDVCKEEFYKDTGIDLSKVYANSYNLERWRQWKQDQVMEIVQEAKNITTDLGPVELGVAVGSPFDRSIGYNYPDISKAADFTLISPSPAQDISLASGMTEKPVYIRLSDDYVEYVLSTQNVDGTVKYIEDLNKEGAGGFAFDYDVVYTPLWSELEPPSQSAQWLLHQLGGKTLGIGNVSWRSDSWIDANNSFDMAGRLSERWDRSPGAVIVGENYSAGLSAAPLASYLNWPILFTGDELPEETASALRRLGAEQVAIVGKISEKARNNLSEMNLSLIEDEDLLVKEMESRNESPNMVVLTNSHDLSLLPPVPEAEVKRDLIGDLLVRVEVSPSQIPAEELGEIVRMNITMTNTGSESLRNVGLLDIFPSGRLITWPRPDQGTVNITDPYTGAQSEVTSAFLNGSLLRWKLDKLEPDKSASLTMDVEILHPMDTGWKREFDGGVTASYEGLTYNLTVERKDDWPVVNITYPTRIFSGVANISWNIDRTSSFTILNLYSPNGRSGSVMISDTSPGKLYSVKTPLITPGKWMFNIEAGDGYTHRTENYTIMVRSAIEPTNITAFSHTKVPRTSLVAAQAAAARKAVLVDLAEDPQKIDPLKEEEALKQKIIDLKLSPQYLMVVGDVGAMPFISTGLMQKPLETKPFEFEVYRDYRIDMDDDNYTETSTGRIMGLSAYDASQLMARTLAYDRLTGDWKKNALVVSSPPLSFPQDPIAMSVRDYLKEAGLNVRDLRYEEASYQLVSSQMNNGQNIVNFNNHGSENLWALSSWSRVDEDLDESHVKQLTLAPQTTSAAACVTSNLKGYTLNASGIKLYVPTRLDDSIALAFIKAGAVNYIGSDSLTWIFVSDDHNKRFHQALVFENATVGQALAEANDLFRLKLKGAESIKKVSDYDEMLPPWDYSIQEMLNQTAGMNIILGDPSFKPYLPKTPPLPYTQEVQSYNQTALNKTSLETSITAHNDEATDWVYWVESDVDTTDGQLKLNAPPAIIAEVTLPKDADKIVVKENGRAVWYDEDLRGDKKMVMWPIVRPRLNETRTFQVEYVSIPGQVQVINVTAGWNPVSIYLQPKDSAIGKYLTNKPYRSVFSAMGGDWDFSMKDTGDGNVTEFEPGRGYLIDSSENFTIELEGKPVEFPYRMKLLQGWNMIGVPMNKTVDMNNITVNAEHKRYKYPEAVGKGIISAFIWSYNDGLGWSHLGENDTLEPGKAYLVEAMSECRLEFRE
jgi:hypothetical protein